MAASEYRREYEGTRRRIPGFAATLVLCLVFSPAGVSSDDLPARSVLVAGSGGETREDEARKVEQNLDEIVGYLLDQGVQASKPQNWRAPPAELVPVARESGAHSVLILNITYGYLEKIRADCYLADGTLLWTERFSGSFGMSHAGERPRLVSKLKSRLAKRVGDSCLPKSP